MAGAVLSSQPNVAETLVGTQGNIVQPVTPFNLFFGAGSPAGVQVGSPGDLYINTSGGAATTLWVKESGVGTTAGWVGK